MTEFVGVAVKEITPGALFRLDGELFLRLRDRKPKRVGTGRGSMFLTFPNAIRLDPNARTWVEARAAAEVLDRDADLNALFEGVTLRGPVSARRKSGRQGPVPGKPRGAHGPSPWGEGNWKLSRAQKRARVQSAESDGGDDEVDLAILPNDLGGKGKRR